MENLIGSQIHQGCRLALPNGLKELMADISREVLRAQPKTLYQFISKYLAALLVTREHLHIACRICGDVCENVCQPTLEAELRTCGLDDDTDKAAAIIVKYFGGGGNKEENLLLELIKRTRITEQQLPAVRQAIENAFLKQKLQDRLPREDSSDFSMDSITRAVNHTLKLYEKTMPIEQEQAQMAVKIQTAYRGYGVRRKISSTSHQPSIISKTVKCRFDGQDKIIEDDRHFRNNAESSLASATLTSNRNLFSVEHHDDLEQLVDRFEKEHNTFDYTPMSHTDEFENSIIADKEIKKINSHPYRKTSGYDKIFSEEDVKLDNYKTTEELKIQDDPVDKKVSITFKGQTDKNEIASDKLAELKESKRFVGDGGPELGDAVDYCHIHATNGGAINDDVANHVSHDDYPVATDFLKTQKCGSLLGNDSPDNIDSNNVDGSISNDAGFIKGKAKLNDSDHDSVAADFINTQKSESLATKDTSTKINHINKKSNDFDTFEAENSVEPLDELTQISQFINQIDH